MPFEIVRNDIVRMQTDAIDKAVRCARHCERVDTDIFEYLRADYRARNRK